MDKSKSDKSDVALIGDLAAVVLRHLPWQWVLFGRDLKVVQQRVGTDMSGMISSGGTLEDFFAAVELDMDPAEIRQRNFIPPMPSRTSRPRGSSMTPATTTPR